MLNVGQKIDSIHCEGKKGTVVWCNPETKAVGVRCDCGAEYIILKSRK